MLTGVPSEILDRQRSAPLQPFRATAGSPLIKESAQRARAELIENLPYGDESIADFIEVLADIKRLMELRDRSRQARS